MTFQQLRTVSAATGASAAIAMGVLGMAFSTVTAAQPEQVARAPVTAEATVGETITQTTPPPTPETTEAKPSLTGPAPLPPEEKDLPG